MIIKFEFDNEKAIQSILDIDRSPNSFEKFYLNKLDSETRKILEENQDPKPLLNEHLNKLDNCKTTDVMIKEHELLWKNIEKEYLNRMERMTGKKFNNSKIKCHLIISQKCRYNPDDRSFMLNIFDNPFSKMLGIGHELFHLHFHDHWFNDIEKILGRPKTHDLKEALTILLNHEFKDLWFLNDTGYPQHQELRKYITEIWINDKNFDRLLEKCTQYLQSTIREGQ